MESVYTNFIRKFSVESPHIPIATFQIMCYTSCILYQCVFLLYPPNRRAIVSTERPFHNSTTELFADDNIYNSLLSPSYLLQFRAPAFAVWVVFPAGFLSNSSSRRCCTSDVTQQQSLDPHIHLSRENYAFQT